jgi:acetate kinase
MSAKNKILVSNIGSTSFKFRLFEMPSEKVLAKGGVERIGSTDCPYTISLGDAAPEKGTASFPDHGAAIRFIEQKLGGFDGIAAVGFKPVMAKGISGTQIMDEPVLRAMEDYNTLLPAHNPPYIAGVRLFNQLHPSLPCIGTFETAFYDHIGPATYRYPVPLEWEEKYGIRRYGFHGASHRFVSQRCAELRGTDKLRVISCHLGGSSSIAAVVDGKAVDSSWGMTPQSGLPQNNRAGDFDCFALIYLARNLGLGLDNVEKALTSQSGLKGMSGLATGDIRDLDEAAAKGNANARADTLIFTAGIGENSPSLRAAVCANLDFCGLELDPELNAATRATETVISKPSSKIEVRVIPTNEEIVIARNAWAKLQESH